MDINQGKIKNNKGEIFLLISFIFLILPFILSLSGDYLRNSVLDKFLDLYLLRNGVYFLSILVCMVFSVLSLINYKKIRGRMTVIVLAIIFIIWNILFLFFNIFSLLPRRTINIDVAIKADISSLRSSGELYASDGNGYEGFCLSPDVNRAKEGIIANKSVLICNSNATGYAACAQLTKNGKQIESYYCSDSVGASKEIKGYCNQDWKYTQCPKD